MTITVLTLFPEMFTGPFDVSMVKRAQEHGHLTIRVVNFRDAAEDTHKTVDDTPYGGGTGMIIKVDVAAKALSLAGAGYKIHLTPKGNMLTDAKLRDLAQKSHLVLFCGHYEGVDDRIRHFVDEELSIGNYILTGGEIPALVVIDALSRHIPGVLPKAVTADESFASGYLEYPQFTRPKEFKGFSVPDILLSGDHTRIAQWKKGQQVQKASSKR